MFSQISLQYTYSDRFSEYHLQAKNYHLSKYDVKFTYLKLSLLDHNGVGGTWQI